MSPAITVYPGIAELLPHEPPTVLLDAVIEYFAGGLVAEVTIRENSRFFVPDRGVPAHVGIEYMAQACGAFAGMEAHVGSQPVRLGFLLGTRRFLAVVPWYAAGDYLRVVVGAVFREGRMAVFDCRIHDSMRDLASARLTVYQQDDSVT